MTLHKACRRDHRSCRLVHGISYHDWGQIRLGFNIHSSQQCHWIWFADIFLVLAKFLTFCTVSLWLITYWTAICKDFAFKKNNKNHNIFMVIFERLFSTHHSLDCSVGESFCAMWYKALMAFMLNRGGLRSAERKKMEESEIHGKEWTCYFFLLSCAINPVFDEHAHPVQYRWSPGTRCPLFPRTVPRPWLGSLLGPSWGKRDKIYEIICVDNLRQLTKNRGY